MIGRHRKGLVAAVAIVAAGLGVAMLPLPAGLDGAASLRVFAVLTAAAVVAVGLLPGIARQSTWSRGLSIGIAVGSLTMGAALFVASGAVQRACTAHYNSRTVIVGTERTSLGAAYSTANPELSNDDLLFDAAGVPERVWTESSIARCRLVIASSYFLWVPCLVMCLAAAVQAMPSGPLQAVRHAIPGSAAGDMRGPARYDAFISYRHAEPDAAFARDLLSALERDGYRVAIDERDFAANASFLQEMERCIRESRFTLAVLSPRYLVSGAAEEEAVLTRVLDFRDRQRRLIPIVIEPLTLPAWLFGIVGIDCTKPNPLVDPFDKLRATLGEPGKPDTVSPRP
jgi:TIR domain